MLLSCYFHKAKILRLWYVPRFAIETRSEASFVAGITTTVGNTYGNDGGTPRLFLLISARAVADTRTGDRYLCLISEPVRQILPRRREARASNSYYGIRPQLGCHRRNQARRLSNHGCVPLTPVLHDGYSAEGAEMLRQRYQPGGCVFASYSCCFSGQGRQE